MDNNINILRIKFYLDIIHKSDLIQWADNNINLGIYNSDVIELSMSNNKSKNEILEILNRLKDQFPYESENFKHIFYSLFNEYLGDISTLEKKLLDFYDFTKDEIHYSEKEILSYSIIANDLSLRINQLPTQLNLIDITKFLTNGYIE
jgi:hypothetical protein